MADDFDDDDLDQDDNRTQVDIKQWRTEKRARVKAEARVAELEAAAAETQREKALSAPELAGLTDDQREALAELHKGEFTTDALKERAVRLGWLQDTEQEQIDDELDRSEKVTQASQTGKTARSTGVLKPEDTADWSMERFLRLKKSNPEAFEALKRGESVVAAGIV